MRYKSYLLPLIVIVVSVATAWIAWPTRGAAAAAPSLPLVQGTARTELDQAVAIARQRLEANADDARAAIRLADVLLRKARVEMDGSHALEAERVLKAVLKQEPGEYSAQKSLGAVYLSQHRFAEAAEIARRGIASRAQDAWNYGVLGDALVELGDYDRAFEAFDRMVQLRPDAASYARVAYAHELQGRLGEALRHLRIAAEATSAHDPESLAWHHAQIGNVLFQMGRLDAAAQEFARANHVFPDHPYARTGMARIAAARGSDAEALAMYRALLAEAPTPELAASVADLIARGGDVSGAEAMYSRAEALEREGWKLEEPQPAALARLFAERGVRIEEAVSLAEQAARHRSDIFTMDTLAWAYFRAGRLTDAHVASERARRTGTLDRRILCHAAAIQRALKDAAASAATVDGAECRFEQWKAEPKTK